MTMPKGYGSKPPSRRDTTGEGRKNSRKWFRLYFIPLGLGIFVFIIFKISFLSLPHLVYLSFACCILAFFFIALASKLRSPSKPVSVAGRIMKGISAPEEEWDPDESPAVMLGANGLFSIVYGLGVTDALTGYAKWLNDLGKGMSSVVSLDLIGILGMSVPYTFRLIGFLVTIIPFIHGTVLMFSNKWYYDKLEDKYHFGVAFIYFIVAFTHAILFFFVTLNILETSRFLLILWIIMFLNILWLCIQIPIQKKILKKSKNYFLPQWALINFNALAFLTIFVFAPPSNFSGKDGIDSNYWYNLFILIILIARSVIDYYVGWDTLYNRIPRKKPEEIFRLSSYLKEKEKINSVDYDNLNAAARELYLRDLPKDGS